MFNKNPFTKTHHTGTSNFSHWKSYKRNSLIKVPVLSTTHTKQMHDKKKSTVHIERESKYTEKISPRLFSAVLISRKKVHTATESNSNTHRESIWFIWGLPLCWWCTYAFPIFLQVYICAWCVDILHGKIYRRNVNERDTAMNAGLPYKASWRAMSQHAEWHIGRRLVIVPMTTSNVQQLHFWLLASNLVPGWGCIE